MKIGPLNEDHQERQERLKQRLKELADAINELKTAVYHHSPFYPEEIYKDLLNAIEVCDSTHDEVLIEGQESEWPKDWYKRGEEQFSELVRKGEVISSKIRQRIESLSAHIGFKMEFTITSRRNVAVTAFKLCAHSKTATYCARYF
jgi:sugar-specific transcriptional regulator TrmB